MQLIFFYIYIYKLYIDMSFSFNNNARVSNLEMLRNTMRYKSSLGIKDKTWKNWAESIDNIIKSINGNKKEIKIEEIGSGKITTLKEIIENILKNLKKNNLKNLNMEHLVD